MCSERQSVVSLGGRATPGLLLADQGLAKVVIVVQPGATEAETFAALELRHYLADITQAEFEIRTMSHAPAGPAIIVGPGAAAAVEFPEVPLSEFGEEEVGIVRKGNRLLLAGGRPRGTLYAVYRFLQDTGGVRWWTPWATDVPRTAKLAVPALNIRMKPAFEARDPFWYPAFDELWAARNGSNSQSARLTDRTGGKLQYKGFVHTFFALVPPDPNFADHPEWFSLVDGKRQATQLCTTNPELRAFLVRRVREWLKEAPDARIVSISQNDGVAGPCQCPDCHAIDGPQGGYAGTMIALLNFIASELGPEFPAVAFDTLAYTYTRQPPRTIRPLPNVIVRLCSIECNFREPLDHPSNADFTRDLVAWNTLCDRLYVWDYTTNFHHYQMPHPNYFVLGANIRFLHRHGVRGLFEQGNYQSHGGEMAELRAWLLAQLMWNPDQDDQKLIDEFLAGYYGKAAGPIREYLELMHAESAGYNLTCYARPDAPHLKFSPLSQAERLWSQAEDAVRDDADKLWRVRQGRLAVWYTWLVRWEPLLAECRLANAVWPVASTRAELAERWLALATGSGPEGWTPLTHILEMIDQIPPRITPNTICEEGWEGRLKRLLGYPF